MPRLVRGVGVAPDLARPPDELGRLLHRGKRGDCRGVHRSDEGSGLPSHTDHSSPMISSPPRTARAKRAVPSEGVESRCRARSDHGVLRRAKETLALRDHPPRRRQPACLNRTLDRARSRPRRTSNRRACADRGCSLLHFHYRRGRADFNDCLATSALRRISWQRLYERLRTAIEPIHSPEVTVCCVDATSPHASWLSHGRRPDLDVDGIADGLPKLTATTTTAATTTPLDISIRRAFGCGGRRIHARRRCRDGHRGRGRADANFPSTLTG